MANLLMGTPSRFEKIEKYGAPQVGAIEQLLSKGLSGLSGGAPSFEPIRERAMRTYKQDILPSIAERWTGMGAQRSSGFQEAQQRSGEDLASTLAAMESQFGQQQFGNLMQMLGVGLTPMQETGYFGGDPGLLKGMAPGMGEALGKGATSGLEWLLPKAGSAIGGAFGTGYGGPMGGAAGSAAGGAAGEGVNKFIKFLMSMFQGGGQQGGQQSGSVSMDPSQNSILGSNII